jgi:hypothetical protein
LFGGEAAVPMVHAYKNTYYPSEFHVWNHERTGDAPKTTSAGADPQGQTMTPIVIGNTQFRDPSARGPAGSRAAQHMHTLDPHTRRPARNHGTRWSHDAI